MSDLKGKNVEVTYKGITYRGRLIDAGSAEIYLQTESRRVVLSMSEIKSVRALPETKR
ncbi:MAG: hypothetical protein ACE5GK_05280 [Nitrospiria bacterium]